MSSSQNFPKTRVTEPSKAEILETAVEQQENAYNACTKLRDILAFLKEMTGDPRQENTITLTDAGVCGLRHVLEQLVTLAENVQEEIPNSLQLYRLAGIPMEYKRSSND